MRKCKISLSFSAAEVFECTCQPSSPRKKKKRMFFSRFFSSPLLQTTNAWQEAAA
jgi:hypothetical protein